MVRQPLILICIVKQTIVQYTPTALGNVLIHSNAIGRELWKFDWRQMNMFFFIYLINRGFKILAPSNIILINKQFAKQLLCPIRLHWATLEQTGQRTDRHNKVTFTNTDISKPYHCLRALLCNKMLPNAVGMYLSNF